MSLTRPPSAIIPGPIRFASGRCIRPPPLRPRRCFCWWTRSRGWAVRRGDSGAWRVYNSCRSGRDARDEPSRGQTGASREAGAPDRRAHAWENDDHGGAGHGRRGFAPDEADDIGLELSRREKEWQRRAAVLRARINVDPYDALFGWHNDRLFGRPLRRWLLADTRGEERREIKGAKERNERVKEWPKRVEIIEDLIHGRSQDEQPQVKQKEQGKPSGPDAVPESNLEYDPISNRMVLGPASKPSIPLDTPVAETTTSHSSETASQRHTAAPQTQPTSATNESTLPPEPTPAPHPQTSPAPVDEDVSGPKSSAMPHSPNAGNTSRRRLPADDIDILLPHDVRARMGRLGKQTEDTTKKAEKREQLEHAFENVQAQRTDEDIVEKPTVPREITRKSVPEPTAAAAAAEQSTTTQDGVETSDHPTTPDDNVNERNEVPSKTSLERPAVEDTTGYPYILDPDDTLKSNLHRLRVSLGGLREVAFEQGKKQHAFDSTALYNAWKAKFPSKEAWSVASARQDDLILLEAITAELTEVVSQLEGLEKIVKKEHQPALFKWLNSWLEPDGNVLCFEPLKTQDTRESRPSKDKTGAPQPQISYKTKPGSSLAPSPPPVTNHNGPLPETVTTYMFLSHKKDWMDPKVTTATSTLNGAPSQKEGSMSIPSALRCLANPALIIPQAATLFSNGFVPVAANINLLVLRKVSSGPAAEAEAEAAKLVEATAAVPDSPSTGHPLTIPESPIRTNPVDGTTALATPTGNFASPTGFVNLDAVEPPTRDSLIHPSGGSPPPLKPLSAEPDPTSLQRPQDDRSRKDDRSHKHDRSRKHGRSCKDDRSGKDGRSRNDDGSGKDGRSRQDDGSGKETRFPKLRRVVRRIIVYAILLPLSALIILPTLSGQFHAWRDRARERKRKQMELDSSSLPTLKLQRDKVEDLMQELEKVLTLGDGETETGWRRGRKRMARIDADRELLRLRQQLDSDIRRKERHVSRPERETEN